jgi:Holliday junction DNA helicase RuvA
MIAFISGTIHAVEDSSLIVVTGGVGYRLFCTGRLLSSVHIGEDIALHVYHHIRDDAQELFGVLDAADYRFLMLVLKVSGVGPKMALGMLSAFSTEQLMRAIVSQDVALLTSISGIGKKTAERIVLELKDASAELIGTGADVTGSEVGNGGFGSGDSGSVASALSGLGYRVDEIAAALAHVDTTLSSEEQLKAALYYLSQR